MADSFTSRLKFLAIVAVFAIPFGIATYIYNNPEAYQPGASNRGTLITPPQSIMHIAAQDSAGAPVPEDLLTRSWFFLFWGEQDCDLYCEANLFKIQKARLMLGRRAARVQNIYLTASASSPSASMHSAAQKYPHLKVLRLLQSSDKASSEPGDAYSIFSQLPRGQVYIVDPLSNVIMSYSKDAPTRDMVKDMKWLIKASKIG